MAQIIAACVRLTRGKNVQHHFANPQKLYDESILVFSSCSIFIVTFLSFRMHSEMETSRQRLKRSIELCMISIFSSFGFFPSLLLPSMKKYCRDGNRRCTKKIDAPMSLSKSHTRTDSPTKIQKSISFCRQPHIIPNDVDIETNKRRPDSSSWSMNESVPANKRAKKKIINQRQENSVHALEGMSLIESTQSRESEFKVLCALDACESNFHLEFMPKPLTTPGD